MTANNRFLLLVIVQNEAVHVFPFQRSRSKAHAAELRA